jgi:hypothetical protein
MKSCPRPPSMPLAESCFERPFNLASKEFVRGARIIINKLQNEPLTFGEPHFHLRHLELEIRIAIVSPLAICYGVHEKSRSVFIKEVKGLAGLGLDLFDRA